MVALQETINFVLYLTCMIPIWPYAMPISLLLTSLSLLASLGFLSIILLSAFSYAREMAGTCKHNPCNLLSFGIGATIHIYWYTGNLLSFGNSTIYLSTYLLIYLSIYLSIYDFNQLIYCLSIYPTYIY